MLKKFLKLAGIGFLIGVVIGDLIAILTGNSATNGITFTSKVLLDMAGGDPVVAMTLQSLFSGIYGAVCFVGMMLYDIERLPLALATAAHCAVIVLLFIPIALLLGWLDNIISILIMSGFQIIGFFIIWLIMYFCFKKQVRELNEMQEHFQSINKDKNTAEDSDKEN